MVVSSLPKGHEEQISLGTFRVSRTEFTPSTRLLVGLFASPLRAPNAPGLARHCSLRRNQRDGEVKCRVLVLLRVKTILGLIVVCSKTMERRCLSRIRKREVWPKRSGWGWGVVLVNNNIPSALEGWERHGRGGHIPVFKES